jgi:hypothetical protein
MTVANPSLKQELHNQAVRAPINAAASTLQDVLSQRLTAFIVGKDSRTVARWAQGEVTEIRSEETEARLRAAYEIALLLLRFDAPETVKAWFISMNPDLDDASPAEAIAEGRFRDAMSAARSFVALG